MTRHVFFLLAAAAGLALAGAAVTARAAEAGETPPPHTLPQCIVGASAYYGVNASVLSAILKVESNFKPHAVNRNRNGTLDLGIGQINSIHFRELAGYGVLQDHLRDYCVGTYVAAWHLRRQMAKYGDNWYAIGAYHSVTPSLNAAYQRRVAAVLRQWGLLQ